MDPVEKHNIYHRLGRVEGKVMHHCAEITKLKASSSGSEKESSFEKFYYGAAVVFALYLIYCFDRDFLLGIIGILKVLV